MKPQLPKIAGYSRLELIGTGGFSRVYSAIEDRYPRQVALKVLNFRLDTDREVNRFEAECAAMAQLSEHPNIVPLYSTTYTHDGFPVIVMQLFVGGTLAGRQTSEVEATLKAGVNVASALHFAHQLGIVHRDVKPKNVLLSKFGEPALTDFGISAIAERAESGETSGITLAYAPPEALEGIADARSDVYSLAATVYSVLAGHHPHDVVGGDQSSTELARKILYEDPPSLRRKNLNAAFDVALIRKGQAKDPDNRPANAEAFGELLRDLQRSSNFELTPFVATSKTSEYATETLWKEAESSRGLDPSVTVIRHGRGKLRELELELEPEPRQRSTRQLVAIGAAALAFGLLALFIGFGSGGSGSEPELTDPPTGGDVQPEPDVELYQAQVFAPTEVTLSRQLDGTVVVTWSDPNEGPVTFEIQRLDGVAVGDPPVSVNGTSHVLAGIADTDAPCITMRALGSGGAISRDIDVPACVGVDLAIDLKISLVPPSCAAGACAFRIAATGLLGNGSVSVMVEGPDGNDLNSVFGDVYSTTAIVDSRGGIDWRFSPQAQAPPGRYQVTVADDLSGQSTIGFFEIESE